MMNVQGDPARAKRWKMLIELDKSFMKTVAEKSMSSQTSLGSVKEFVRTF
jgi:hypothetical protein